VTTGGPRRLERRWWRGAATAALLLLLPSMVRAQSVECDAGAREVRSLDFRGNRAFRDNELALRIETTASSLMRRTLRALGTRRCLDSDALRLDVGPSRERQGLTELLDRGRRNDGPRVSGALLKATFGSGGFVNPLAQMLRDGEKLHLDGTQADSLAAMNVALTGALDSLWTEFGAYAATVPGHYDQGDVYARYRQARRASIDVLIAMVPRIRRILSDVQQRQLAPGVARYLDLRYLAAIRAGSEGNSTAGPFANGTWPSANGSGTGRRTDIIVTRP